METKLKIHLYGDKILRKKASFVDEITPQIKELLDEMVVLMKLNHGIGLAANQVGVALKLIVVDLEGKIMKLINPVITKHRGKIDSDEGCLSFPGLTIKIKRWEEIWVSALNDEGEEINLEAHGLSSVVLQHEIDHINGILFIDRLPFWKRWKIYPILKKIKKTAEERGG